MASEAEFLAKILGRDGELAEVVKAQEEAGAKFLLIAMTTVIASGIASTLDHGMDHTGREGAIANRAMDIAKAILHTVDVEIELSEERRKDAEKSECPSDPKIS